VCLREEAGPRRPASRPGGLRSERHMLLTGILITGLIVGGVYALTAMGLTMQYGVARILNLAYGELFIASAFAAWWFYSTTGLSPLLSLAVILPAAFLVNWLIYQLLLVPLV